MRRESPVRAPTTHRAVVAGELPSVRRRSKHHGGTMTTRIDVASRLIHASPMDIYQAFAQRGSMEQWLPPENMCGKMLRFDFRAGGSYRMRLTYRNAEEGQGQT